MKVLIVDDSAEALAIAKARLAKEGLDVVCAGGGRAGLEAAERERPDLILLDLDMPDMSGFEVCRALKANTDLCMIPVIFLSGSGTDDDKVVGLDLGAVDYVTKPFDVFELRARVRAALRTKRLQDLLIHFGQVDPLTELNNRRVLMERLREEWARIQRHSGSLAFIMADIDHFKRINDAHGHPQGDRVLCEVAKAIASECRQSDIPGRYGGEEFAVVCVESDAESAAGGSPTDGYGAVNRSVRTGDQAGGFKTSHRTGIQRPNANISIPGAGIGDKTGRHLAGKSAGGSGSECNIRITRTCRRNSARSNG